jgi:phosphoglycerate dehydrogenase-like enzyme
VKIVLFDPHERNRELETALAAFSDISFEKARDVQGLRVALPQAEILIASNRSYTAEPAATIREHGRALRWIQFSTSGIDKAVTSGFPSGVIVTNAAGLRSFAVAEHAFALMFGLARHLGATERARADAVWLREEITPFMENLSGKHLALVGLGSIGQEIARKAKAFDMRVTGISRASGPVANVDAIRPRDELRAAAAEADVLLLALAYDEQTDKILSRGVIQAMQPTAYVVNIARGKLVDEAALIDALRAKKIAGAGLDVTETEPLPAGHPFWTMPNVLLTPHVGGTGSKGDRSGFAKIFVDNLQRWRRGEPLSKVAIERTP